MEEARQVKKMNQDLEILKEINDGQVFYYIIKNSEEIFLDLAF